MSHILGDSTAPNRQPARSPFKPSAKPTSRKSLSALPRDRDTSNAPMTDAAPTRMMEDPVGGGDKVRKRAYSVGGVAGGKNQLSPRSQARRTAVSNLATFWNPFVDLWYIETSKINLKDGQCTIRLLARPRSDSGPYPSPSITAPPSTARTYHQFPRIHASGIGGRRIRVIIR